MQLVRPSVDRLRQIAAETWDVATALSQPSVESGDYDSYLLEAADRLQEGAADDDVADYFINVATEELGVDTGSGMRARALVLAKAIRQQVESVEPADAEWMRH